MKTMPQVRPHPRAFTLGFVRREMLLQGKTPMAGFSAMVIFGKRDEASFRLLIHFADWRIQQVLSFDSMHQLLLIAQSYVSIHNSEWIGCHPPQGTPLYGSPRSKIEKLHRAILENWQWKIMDS